MIKKALKGLIALNLACFFAFLTLFSLADALYPNSLSCPDGEEIRDVFVFSVKEDREAGTGTVFALGALPVKEVSLHYYEETQLLCGGELFGVRLNTRGLLVTRLGEVNTDGGEVSPALQAGLKKGDVILSVEGVEPKDATDFSKLIARSQGKALTLTVERGGETLSLSLSPALSRDGTGYKAGIWVRDGAAGMGTVTFVHPETGVFGGLGHAICDSETGVLFPLASGDVCLGRVEGIQKGQNGTPGEIRGSLGSAQTGTLLANTPQGVFGILKSPAPSQAVTPAGREEIKEGAATLFCTLDEEGKKEYRIEIETICNPEGDTKNFIVKVTDPLLLEKTGGIVQGMSGSPILQNGKLIGAVTHVLVNDPTRGYGIFIENMLNAAE